MYSLTFRACVMLPQQRNLCPDCKSAQQCTTRGHPLPFPKLHPGPCNSVGMQTHTQTDTQTRVTTIHFASSTTHAKCSNKWKWSTQFDIRPIQSYSPGLVNVHPHVTHASSDPPESKTQMASRSVQPFFARLKTVTDRRTDQPTEHADRSEQYAAVLRCDQANRFALSPPVGCYSPHPQSPFITTTQVER